MPNDDFSEIGQPRYEGPDSDPPPPGPDPRMSPEYIDSIMRSNKTHSQPKSEYMTATQVGAESPRDTNSLNSLISRLEQVNKFAGHLHGYIINLNDRLNGPIPQGGDSGGKSDNPTGCLNYAHYMVDDISARLSRIEDELRRLEANIGS